jgi:uncharacterized protein (TIGR02996 family)
VTFGRVGTNGQAQTKEFPDAATATKERDKLVAEKLKKGYVETTGADPTSVASTEQKALESALAEHPDEVAAHSAYADYLTEAGDPRGEFIQTQLALEDPARSKPERDALRKRETALLKKHARAWLGDAGRFLVGKWSGEDKPYHYRFVRGWLDFVRTLPVPEALVAVVAQAPEARLLRRLEVVYDMRHHPFDFEQFTQGPSEQVRDGERASEVHDAFPTLHLLAGSPHMSNLRALKYGFSDDHDRGPSHSTMVDPFGTNTAEQMLDLLKACPRLEELYLNVDLTDIETLFASPLLGNLRVLQHYYGFAYRAYGEDRSDPNPLRVLAENKSLKSLTTLRFHPGRDSTIKLDEFDALLCSKCLPALIHLQVHMTTFGDDGADRLVSSGILKRLKTLDIGYGNMTDDGARVLAASPDVKNLESLDVSRNALTSMGIGALRGTGVRIVADAQHGAGGDDDNEYCYSVDWE